MRFRLIEGPADETPKAKQVKPEWPPTRQTLDKYNKLLTHDEQLAFLEERIFPHKVFKRLFGIRELLIGAIQSYGLDPKRNLFLDFITKIPFDIPNRKLRPKIQYIYDSYKNKKLNIRDQELSLVLNNPSLYDRSDKEFKYTLNAFNIMSQPDKASAYIKDTKDVDITKFLLDGTDLAKSTIKPGGSDGKEGDTIFNVIEDWSKDNEYSPEEIAQRKAAVEKEKDKDKTTDGKMSNTFIGIVPDTEWTYDYFKGELEKIFANKSKFKIELPSKNDYLSRVFATFSLASLEPSETSNKVYKKNTKDVKDADVSKFGDPHSIDTPIPMSVRTADDEVPGVYAFHQFIPLDDASMTMYKQVANKNLGNLKRHLHNVKPSDDAGADYHLQAMVDAIGSLQDITHR